MPIGHIRWNVLKLMVVFLKGLKGFYLCGVEGEKNLTSKTNCCETPVWETPQWVPSDLTLHPFKISSLTLIWATHVSPPPLFSFLSLCLEYLLMYKIFEFLYGYHNKSFKVYVMLRKTLSFLNTQGISTVFSSSTFMISDFTLKSLNCAQCILS